MLAVFATITAPSAHARARHSNEWARERFTAAEKMREALNGRPPADRTRHDYQRVLNAYRSIYLGAPSSSKADPSVVAVAETLVEMGRRFADDKILHRAINQYKFLRREYPGSKYRIDGLFTIAEIYKDDLNDHEGACAAFQEFLRHYPHNRLADDARQAIVELDKDAEAGKAGEAQEAAKKKNVKNNQEINNADAKEVAEDHASRAATAKDESPKDRASGARSGHLPRVTGIRHWSTPDYSRIAIDLEGDVKFSSERIARPSRIYFDLHDTRLASTLVGKSFDVDDVFLKKVRVAQFAPGRTRIVLEIDNLSDYDAFMLPNPYRLIIDIHGKNERAKQLKDASESASAVVEGKPQSKATPDTETEMTSAGTRPTAAANSALAPAGQAPVADGTSNDATAAVFAPSAVPKNMRAAVVKKIVDADYGDDSTASPVEVANANVPDLKATSKSRNLSDSRHRAPSRALASSKTGILSDLSVREAKPTAAGDRSLIRALGLKIGKIVIDPGHGGHDTGTIGPNGLEEKDLVLEVSRRLGKLLETRLGAEVVYTRKDDTFIPLETRTAVANQAHADLFVSVHANSSHDPAARGVETYYLNFTSSPEALEVAARENAVSEKSIYELQDLVKKIALKEKIEESREFAWDVQQSLHSGLAIKSPAIRDRGVKKAPFIVLIGANMPSILAEISFVSNPTDERRLATSEYRQRIAESLYRGIARYVNGLSGIKVASKMDKAAGQ